MSYIKDSIKFILKHNFKIHGKVKVEEIRLGKIPADLYIPKKSRGTILLIHGMNHSGNKDPRMINLSRSFAGAGYTVIMPFFKKIAALRIEKSQIQSIKNAIRITASDKKLAPYGKIGLFSISFSGGLSLIAAADPEVKDMISSILIVGGYGDAKETIESIMKRSYLDDYASMITFYNFIELTSGKNKDLAKAFYLSAMDNSKNTDQLTPHLKKLSPSDRNLFFRLKTDPEA
ncbi:MAG: hypothetical protein OEZ34_13665, partial [Spirochaetia bacterium]|nr:hypothetical protein [Spirochaetia bacterium]